MFKLVTLIVFIALVANVYGQSTSACGVGAHDPSTTSAGGIGLSSTCGWQEFPGTGGTINRVDFKLYYSHSPATPGPHLSIEIYDRTNLNTPLTTQSWTAQKTYYSMFETVSVTLSNPVTTVNGQKYVLRLRRLTSYYIYWRFTRDDKLVGYNPIGCLASKTYPRDFDFELYCQATCSPACANGGKCSGGACVCTGTGYSGASCSTPTCSPACVNGMCVAPNTCNCSAGWMGNDCNTAKTCQNTCSATHGVCTEADNCHCKSGWTGANCDVAPPANCQIFEVAPLNKTTPTIIDKSTASYNNDVLHFDLHGDVYGDRVSKIVLGRNGIPNAGDTIADFCTWPDSPYMNYTVNTTGTCQDKWQVNIPFALARKCSWIRSEDAQYIYFANNLYVTHVDLLLPDLRGDRYERETTHVFPLLVKFQKTATVTFQSPINLQGDLVGVAAVTKQDTTINNLDISSDPVGEIDLSTSTASPYYLVNMSVIEYPNIGFDSIITYGDSNETNCPLGQICYQTFFINIVPGKACVLTGTYNVSLAAECNDPANPTNCPQKGRLLYAAFDIQTENFCSVTSVDVTLSAEMKGYGDAGRTTSLTTVAMEIQSWFTVFAISTATISSTNLRTLICTGPKDRIFYLSGNKFGDGNAVSLNVNDQATQTDFDFIWARSVFAQDFTLDETKKYSLTATIQVTYQATVKRGLLASTTSEMDVSTNVGLAGGSVTGTPTTVAPNPTTTGPTVAPNPTPSPDSALSLVMSFGLLIVALLF